MTALEILGFPSSFFKSVVLFRRHMSEAEIFILFKNFIHLFLFHMYEYFARMLECTLHVYPVPVETREECPAP